MSKQSDAKAAQQYTKESPKCGNCKRCGVGGFAIVTTGWCEKHTRGAA